MRRTLVWLLGAALVVGLGLPAGAQMPNLKGREIRIGTDPTYPPFEFTDKDKNIVGFDVDLVTEICKRVNCKTKWVATGFEGIFVALSKGQFDAVVSGVTITDERKKAVAFTSSYLRYGQVVLVRAVETRIKGLNDLKGKTVGVQIGTTNAEAADKFKKEGKVGQVKQYKTFDLAVAALINKDIDAVIIDSPAADGFMAANKGKLKKAGAPFTSEDLGIAVRKGDAALLAALNAGLAAVRRDGTWNRLYKKWFVDFKPGG